MPTFYGMEKSRLDWMGDAPPRYSQINEGTPLVAKKCRENIKQILGIRRSSLLLILYVIFYVVYLITGGLVFTVLEAPEEEQLRSSLLKVKKDFLASNPCILDQDLEDLIEKIVSASNRGVSATKNVSGEPNWSFEQSLFFSSTVVTTIGYGHVTPLSRAGKCFCIVYAMLGIPLTLMLFSALVDRLMIPSTNFLQYLNSKLGHLYQPFNIRLLHLTVVSVFILVFFLLVPAAIFSYVEPKWDYLDSIYYCFISLTTIGLGDYIPGDSSNQEYRPLYKLLATGYLLAGVTFLAYALTVFYDIPQLNFGVVFMMESDELPLESIDPEKVRLQTPGALNYTEQMDIDQEERAVKITSRGDDSSSIDDLSPEDFSPVHALP